MTESEDSSTRYPLIEESSLENQDCEVTGGNGHDCVSDPAEPVFPAGRENTPPSPEASYTNELHQHNVLSIPNSTSSRSLSGCAETTLMVLKRQKEYKLADVQAKQTGDMEQLSQKLESTVEAHKHSEFEDVGSFMPPSEGLLLEKQNGSLQFADELRAVTKNSDSLGAEVQVNHTTVSDQEAVLADPTMKNCYLDMEDMLPSHSLQNSSVFLDISHQYTQLTELLHQQEEKCRRYCQQFSHMGNITETVKFESLAEECVSLVEALKVALVRGYPVPKFHMEDRSFNTFKIIPELSGSEMLLTIVRGINLPIPGGISLHDLETSVRFEFAFPSLQESQRDQTHSVKSSISPEFGEQFALQIKRGHRGFKRAALSKGIKFEIVQKGTERVVGSAQLKLDSLESECETRQLVEVFKRRTPTGGHLEVRVRIREPLGGPRFHTVTEKWLVLDPLTLPLVVAPKRDSTVERVSSRSPICSVL